MCSTPPGEQARGPKPRLQLRLNGRASLALDVVRDPRTARAPLVGPRDLQPVLVF
jgi:hypothetical protein